MSDSPAVVAALRNSVTDLFVSKYKVQICSRILHLILI